MNSNLNKEMSCKLLRILFQPSQGLKYCFLACCLLLVLLQQPRSVFASSTVNGLYHAVSGNLVGVTISVNSRTPLNLIVDQYFSPANKIISTSPTARKIDGSRGNAKWLFRNVRQGKLSIQMKFAKPLQGQITGVIRYRDPVGGGFQEIRFTP